jgi:hypothetical protein
MFAWGKENRGSADRKTNELSVSEQLASLSYCLCLGTTRFPGVATRCGLIRRAESGHDPFSRRSGATAALFRVRAMWRNDARGANSVSDRPMRAPRPGSCVVCISPARAARRGECPLRQFRRKRCCLARGEFASKVEAAPFAALRRMLVFQHRPQESELGSSLSPCARLRFFENDVALARRLCRLRTNLRHRSSWLWYGVYLLLLCFDEEKAVECCQGIRRPRQIYPGPAL